MGKRRHRTSVCVVASKFRVVYLFCTNSANPVTARVTSVIWADATVFALRCDLLCHVWSVSPVPFPCPFVWSQFFVIPVHGFTIFLSELQSCPTACHLYRRCVLSVVLALGLLLSLCHRKVAVIMWASPNFHAA